MVPSRFRPDLAPRLLRLHRHSRRTPWAVTLTGLLALRSDLGLPPRLLTFAGLQPRHRSRWSPRPRPPLSVAPKVAPLVGSSASSAHFDSVADLTNHSDPQILGIVVFVIGDIQSCRQRRHLERVGVLLGQARDSATKPFRVRRGLRIKGHVRL